MGPFPHAVALRSSSPEGGLDRMASLVLPRSGTIKERPRSHNLLASLVSLEGMTAECDEAGLRGIMGLIKKRIRYHQDKVTPATAPRPSPAANPPPAASAPSRDPSSPPTQRKTRGTRGRRGRGGRGRPTSQRPSSGSGEGEGDRGSPPEEPASHEEERIARMKERAAIRANVADEMEANSSSRRAASITHGDSSGDRQRLTKSMSSSGVLSLPHRQDEPSEDDDASESEKKKKRHGLGK